MEKQLQKWNLKVVFSVLFFAFGFLLINAQTASSYTFTATTATYANLTGTTNVGGLNNTSDDVLSNTTNIGFTFNFAGTDYTQFKVSSNGFITFNTASTDSFFLNSEANAGTNKPVLMPLWDDLQSTARVRYRLDGTTPNRIMKIEFRGNEWDYQSGADAIKFQVWLYEGSNRIEFRYQQSADPVNNPSATIGIYDSNDTYLTLDSAGASPTASSSTFTTDIAAKPANNQVYRFDPPTYPVITVLVTSLPSFEACNLTVSGSQTFQVSGILLTDDILITAPTGFEVSTDDVSFSDSLVLTQSGGNVATTTIYARMKALSSNPTPATIALTSTGATTRNVSVSGELISPTGVSAGIDVSVCASSTVVLDGSADYDATIQTLSTIDGDTGFATMTTNDTNRWGISATTNAGGSANELRMQWFSGGDPTLVTIWVQSPLLDATELTNLSMDFKHNLDWFAGNAPLALQTSPDGTTWTTRWSQTATGDVAATTVTVDLSAVNQSAFYYRFLYDGNIYNIDNWYIDDIVITGNFVEPIYSWTSIPSGFTSTEQDPTVNPTVTTTYILEVTSNGCTVTDEVVVSVESTTWTSASGGSWDNGAPTATTAAVIAYDYTSSGNLDACSLTVNNDAIVVISSGDVVSLSGGLTVASGSSFTLENEAYLMQEGSSNPNSGDITVKQESQALMRLDYGLWSSPVENQNLLAFSPLTMANRFYTYNTTTDVYATIVPSTNSFTTGKGYLIRMPDNHPTSPTVWEGNFEGKPNSGDLTIALSTAGGGYNAVGNPYPSPISIDTFIDDNSSVIDGDLFFWRKTNGAAGSAYITYSGGVFSDGPHAVDNIQPGQGFIVKATAASNLQFNNAQRATGTGVFYRNAQESAASRLWLQLKNNNTVVGSMAVGYREDATNGIDSGLDGNYINDSALALTSVVEGTLLAVQQRAAFEATDVVPLAFKTNVAGTFEIALHAFDGLFTGDQNVYVRDIVTGAEHNLKDGSYTFTTTTGEFNNRFELIYQSTLSVENPVLSANVVVYTQAKNMHVAVQNTTISEIKVFDMRGRLVKEATDVNDVTFTADLSAVANQVLIVQIKTAEGEWLTRKIAL